ncbi:MAG TPA: bifunctional 4-hydroxy-2-oxoglutarate aldolase/2-dehydro-3-deoxy-phosphogluconate aldolase [Gammaproteobacteria bacterium]|nr:bifunctional 4-hydroxy-2-oxoglutarate aldolase/2-dehydro-3-deoxy-phosphogluconate aldolase [Gammaproteobacteria bacterium]
MHAELLKLQKVRIIPVLALPNVADAAPVAEALVKGGLPCAEVTFRTDAAVEAIRIMAKRGDMQVGAGTVLKVDQVKAAVDAGATFIVSPGINPKVVKYCVDNGIPITPGTANPTDIEVALDHGLEVVKFFPAETLGGLEALQAFSAPYNMMRFIPTGGIGPKNLLDYLKFPKVIACGGTWMVKAELIAEKKFDQIASLSREAVQLAAGSRS